MADYEFSWLVTIAGSENDEGYEVVQVDADRLEVTPGGALVFHDEGRQDASAFVICVLASGSYLSCQIMNREDGTQAGFRWGEGRVRY